MDFSFFQRIQLIFKGLRRWADSINVNILVVILCYRLARCILAGKDRVSGTGIFLYYFSQMHVNQQSPNKKFKDKEKDA